MRSSLASHRRGLERLLAIFTALAVFTGLMAVFAPPAQAHHPEISANQTCVDGKVVVAYESVSWRTDGGSGSDHPDIRIEVQVNGAGPWIEVASGAYTAENNYRFSGNFDAEPYWGDSIVVRARANGPWGNGVGGGETRSTTSFTVDQDCFNPSCPSGYYEHKVESVTEGTHGTFFTISNIADNGSGPTFDWSSTRPVYQVIVKGGPGANVYDYSGDTSDTGLHAPLNPKNGKWYGLSHVTFCYGDPVPEEVTVTPQVDVCAVGDQGLPEGAVSFDIDPASGATVNVYANPDFTGQVGGPLGDDETLSLPPGTYYWEASAATGFEIEGAAGGELTIDPCDAVVVVTSGDCVLDEAGLPVGEVVVSIDPESGATVQIAGPGGPYDFAGSGGSVELAPGSYTWTATAASGYQLEGEDEGAFTIDPCDVVVVVTSGDCSIDQQGQPVGEVVVTIDPASGATVVVSGPGGPYQFSGSGGSQVLAPGSYSWEATASAGFDLDGEVSGEFTIDPCQASVVVAAGQCELVDGPRGTVTVFIDTESGATVTVYDDQNAVVAVFDGVGGSTTLPPGSYSWEATPGDGFEFPEGQATSGSFTIDPCAATVVVTHGNCVEGATTAFGSVTVVIDPASAATVTVSGPGGPYVFSGAGGSQAIDDGAYSWQAVAGDGFALVGAASGSFTVLPCEDDVLGEVIENDDPVEDEVLDQEILPFTGFDTELLLAAALGLLGSGLILIVMGRRRRQI